MKVAIATDQDSVSAHFGRCDSYSIYEIEEGKILDKKIIPNPGHEPGFLPQFLAEREVTCIIAGGMGPRAQNLFSQKNIKTITGVQGKIEEVIEQFLEQDLASGEDLCGHRKGEHQPTGYKHREKGKQTDMEKIICFSALGKELSSEIDPRFGRAAYFLFINIRTGSFEAVKNPFVDAGQGAGTQTAQMVADKGATTVFTGDCGPKAKIVLQAAGIEVKTGFSGKVEEILRKY
ncbi:MAG: hypothetical protein JXB26_10515 [Candidatus Aminicenantes bacterium]|nr:hypothetical protein [Candidatus Aminicenantes bacterium]